MLLRWSLALATHTYSSSLYVYSYYLQYQNVRPEYVKNIWSVVDWNAVEARLTAAK